MKRLVVGYGNTLRGDDGFGYRAAERIAGAIAVPQLAPELMEPISRADRVLFLDASVEGVPGELRLRAVHPNVSDAAFTHHATPEALLAGARALYGRAPEAEILSVCGASFDLGETLSPCVQAALERLSGILFNAEPTAPATPPRPADT